MSVVGCYIFPKSRLAYSGTDVKFTCHSANFPLWFKNGALAENYTSIGMNMVIKSVTTADSGRYTCAGVGRNGKSFHAVASLLVYSK